MSTFKEKEKEMAIVKQKQQLWTSIENWSECRTKDTEKQVNSMIDQIIYMVKGFQT